MSLSSGFALDGSKFVISDEDDDDNPVVIVQFFEDYRLPRNLKQLIASKVIECFNKYDPGMEETEW